MRHNHLVTDSDSYFVIDPITRQLSNGTSKKLSLIKGDHNSERFTFELPLHVEGHDMSLCNKVEVHYINVDSKTRAKNEGVYIITDHDDAFKINPDNPDTVIAEWLISGNVTQYAGTLSFIIRYMCLGENGVIDYAWNTSIYSGIGVLDSINNSDVVVEEYSDVLQEWYEKLLSAFDGNIDLNSKEAVKFWVGSHAGYTNLEEIIEDCLYIITDDGTLEDLKEKVSTHESTLISHSSSIFNLNENMYDLDGRVHTLEVNDKKNSGTINQNVTTLTNYGKRIGTLEQVKYDYEVMEKNIATMRTLLLNGGIPIEYRTYHCEGASDNPTMISPSNGDTFTVTVRCDQYYVFTDDDSSRVETPNGITFNFDKSAEVSGDVWNLHFSINWDYIFRYGITKVGLSLEPYEDHY